MIPTEAQRLSEQTREERLREAETGLRGGGWVTFKDADDANELLNRLARQLAEAEARKTRAVYIAKHLLEMIPRQVWRDQGGDDGQGHYEGDYWADQTYSELQELDALNPLDPPAPPAESGK